METVQELTTAYQAHESAKADLNQAHEQHIHALQALADVDTEPVLQESGHKAYHSHRIAMFRFNNQNKVANCENTLRHAIKYIKETEVVERVNS